MVVEVVLGARALTIIEAIDSHTMCQSSSETPLKDSNLAIDDASLNPRDP